MGLATHILDHPMEGQFNPPILVGQARNMARIVNPERTQMILYAQAPKRTF